MRIAVFLFVAAFFISLCPASRADDQEAAKAAFKKGSDLFHEGKFDEAALAFREANTLSPNWKLLYNIGQSEAAAKRHGLALQAFEEYLSEGGDDIKEARRLEVAQEVTRLRGIVGEVSIVAPDGSEIFLDGRQRGTAPLPGPIPVPAGKLNELRIEKDGEVILAREIRVGSGRSIKVDAAIEDDDEAGPVASEGTAPLLEDEAVDDTGGPAAVPPDGVDGLKVGGWVLVGVGAAVLVGSAVTGGMALKLDGDLDEACPDSDCAPAHHEDVDKLKRLSVASDVMTGVGGAALAAGVVMVVVSAVRGRSDSEESNVTMAPVAGAGGLGLVLEGRF